jgi:hypothetical protein
MGISSQWWNHHGILPSDSTALKHDLLRVPWRQRVRRWLHLHLLWGRVSDLSCASAEHSPKRIPLDAHPDDPGMHLDGLGNTDRLPGEPLPPGPQRQRLARALLRVALTRRGRLALSLARVSAPRVRIIFRDSHGLQARFALPTYGVLATPTPRGQDLATAGIERRLQPARGFVPPHP